MWSTASLLNSCFLFPTERVLYLDQTIERFSLDCRKGLVLGLVLVLERFSLDCRKGLVLVLVLVLLRPLVG